VPEERHRSPKASALRAKVLSRMKEIIGIFLRERREVAAPFRGSAPLAHALQGQVWAALLVVSLAIPAGAQTTKQVWPELSAYVKLNDQMRFYLLSTTVKENKESTEIEMGPNFDFYLKPLAKNPKLLLLRLDESKNRPLMVRVGYRFIHPIRGNSSTEHRGVLEATARFPLVIGMLVSDRSRIDFRSVGGEYSWRYRNRLTMEGHVSVGRVTMNPYVRAEVYYDSRYSKWSRTALTAGSAFPIKKHFELESYFEHHNNTGGSSNQELNAVGAVVNFYF
jgi:hypothetical protein